MAKFRGFIKKCEVCGKEFKVSPSQNHVRSCSYECGYKIRKIANKVDWVVKACKTCGTEFSRPPSIAKNQVYCSYDCQFADKEYIQSMSDRTSGENNPAWKGGSTVQAVSHTGRIYRRAQPGVENAKSNARRATKLNATPVWADLGKIQQIYTLCKQISETTGVLHHVDHVVPLQGRRVCGLHVESNLRIISATENISKSNNFLIEEPQ